MIIQPDDYPYDWYGWLTNQCGHALIGVVSLGVMWFSNIDPLVAVPAIVIFYFFIVESCLQGLDKPWDSLTDTWFVFLGSLVSSSLITYNAKMFFGSAMVLGISFAVGCLRRSK